MNLQKDAKAIPVQGVFAIAPGLTQNVAFTTATASTAFNASTTIVRVVATAACYIRFGVAPTAVIGDLYLPVDKPEYFQVTGGYKVSALQVGSGGILNVTEIG